MGSRLSIVCTDRGQHAWVALGDLLLDDHPAGPQLRANIGAVYGERADRRKQDCVRIDEHGRAHMWCPRCRRHVIRSRIKATEMITTLHGLGESQLDISSIA